MARRYLLGTTRGTSCCGLHEFHGLSVSLSPSNYNSGGLVSTEFSRLVQRGRAYIATTGPGQGGVVKVLKARRFKKVGTWRNSNTGNKVTLWAFIPGRPKRRKK